MMPSRVRDGRATAAVAPGGFPPATVALWLAGTPIVTNPTPLGLSAWPTGVGGAEFGLAVEAGFVRPGVLG